MTIRLMGLGTELRRDLIESRCLVLMRVWRQIERREEGHADAQDRLARAIEPHAPHSACAAALLAAFEDNPEATARLMADVEQRYEQLYGRATPRSGSG